MSYGSIITNTSGTTWLLLALLSFPSDIALLPLPAIQSYAVPAAVRAPFSFECGEDNAIGFAALGEALQKYWGPVPTPEDVIVSDKCRKADEAPTFCFNARGHDCNSSPAKGEHGFYAKGFTFVTGPTGTTRMVQSCCALPRETATSNCKKYSLTKENIAEYMKTTNPNVVVKNFEANSNSTGKYAPESVVVEMCEYDFKNGAEAAAAAAAAAASAASASSAAASASSSAAIATASALTNAVSGAQSAANVQSNVNVNEVEQQNYYNNNPNNNNYYQSGRSYYYDILHGVKLRFKFKDDNPNYDYYSAYYYYYYFYDYSGDIDYSDYYDSWIERGELAQATAADLYNVDYIIGISIVGNEPLLDRLSTVKVPTTTVPPPGSFAGSFGSGINGNGKANYLELGKVDSYYY